MLQNYKPQSSDMYLSPHPDDVCFSLGHTASMRKCGKLITIFSKSIYQAKQCYGATLQQITSGRHGEDKHFASKCKLNLMHLGFPDSMVRGQDSFDIRLANEVALFIEEIFISVLMKEASKVKGHTNENLPLLFCPAAIGGHIDHLAVLITILKWQHLLGKYFHIVFYEDLFYASNAQTRITGLDRLFALQKNAQMTRICNRLEQIDCVNKMNLISIYQSQLTDGHYEMDSYIPASGDVFAHEAIWLNGYDRAQASG